MKKFFEHAALVSRNRKTPKAGKHYYKPTHIGLLELGLEPHFLTDDVLREMMELVMKYKDRINHDAIFRGVKWG